MMHESLDGVLPNGIVLPPDWPPATVDFGCSQPMRVPYLERPPAVIPIDLGRQLLLDDFLVQHTSMTRVFHQPVKHPCNPVLFPSEPHERPGNVPPCAVAKCGGVWHDPRDGRFKMWYMAGYGGVMCYAESGDGVHWVKPALDVVPGTNQCLPPTFHPDSGTVWLDDHAADGERFKMLFREPNHHALARAGIERGNAPGLLMASPDGIHWGPPRPTGPMGDRSTLFFNPFRNRWVQSIRDGCPRGRCRRYFEHADFWQSGAWTAGQPVPWMTADCHDVAGDSLPQLYTLDAVAYESVLIGLFQILKGPPNHIGALRGEPKLTELVLGSSRDGFHWHRPDRRAFIGARREPGAWEFGYVEASGGICLIVGDELWFYYSAYAGEPSMRELGGIRNGMYGNGAVGLAKLRRDGFASLQPRHAGGLLQTRPVRFSGTRLFVNAETAGSALRAAVLDETGHPLPGLGLDDSEPFIGNSTCAELRWRQPGALAAVGGRPVRLEFHLDQGALYAFWASAAVDGRSGGYLAAGGPGLRGSRDD